MSRTEFPAPRIGTPEGLTAAGTPARGGRGTESNRGRDR